MSIQTELTRLTNAKAAIQTAIEGKGITVPVGTLLDGMAALIEAEVISFSDFKYNFSKVYYGDITYDNDFSLFGNIYIDAPDVTDKDLLGAQIIIIVSDDTAYSTTESTLAAAMQFISNNKRSSYSNPTSLIRFGVEYRLKTSGNYISGMAGAIYDADGNTTNLAYETREILSATALPNKQIALHGNGYNGSRMIFCAAKTYHYLILAE